MNKWFNRKFEKKNNRNSQNNFFKKLSMTNKLILLNVIIFVLVSLSLGIFDYELVIKIISLNPINFFSGDIWALFTSMFVHVQLWHLLANMVSLFFIGNFVEKIIGKKRLLGLYLISGIFAGVFYVTLSYFFGVTEIGARIFGDPSISAVGASGAIFALLGILAILTPNTKVYLIAGPIIALILQSILTPLIEQQALINLINLLVYAYLIFSIFVIFSFNPRLTKIAIPLEMPLWILPMVAIIPLAIIGLFFPLPIGNSAHFGGLIAGLIYGHYLRKKYKKKTAMIRKYFS